jgi:hypothetical protein
MSAKLATGMVNRWLSVRETPKTSKLCAKSEPEADCASKCKI